MVVIYNSNNNHHNTIHAAIFKSIVINNKFNKNKSSNLSNNNRIWMNQPIIGVKIGGATCGGMWIGLAVAGGAGLGGVKGVMEGGMFNLSEEEILMEEGVRRKKRRRVMEGRGMILI